MRISSKSIEMCENLQAAVVRSQREERRKARLIQVAKNPTS